MFGMGKNAKECGAREAGYLSGSCINLVEEWYTAPITIWLTPIGAAARRSPPGARCIFWLVNKNFHRDPVSLSPPLSLRFFLILLSLHEGMHLKIAVTTAAIYMYYNILQRDISIPSYSRNTINPSHSKVPSMCKAGISDPPTWIYAWSDSTKRKI